MLVLHRQDHIAKAEDIMGWGQWEADSWRIRDKYNLPADGLFWTKPLFGRRPPIMRGVPRLPRLVDLINTGYGVLPMLRVVLEYYVNLSQGHVRTTTFGYDISLCGGAVMYSYHLDRVLSPNELLAVMGYPSSEHDFGRHLNDDDLVHAIGNGMFGGSIGSVLSAVVYNSSARWWRRP